MSYPYLSQNNIIIVSEFYFLLSSKVICIEVIDIFENLFNNEKLKGEMVRGFNVNHSTNGTCLLEF